ncbi:MAG: DUF1905 domain-containing protein [Myxococcales bacterium]|nr:DUF1905 domain-containing protein [Myxococcales bacterium]
MPGVRKKLEAVVGAERSDLFIELPFDVRETFGRARPPVRVTVNGYAFRSTVAVYSGRYYIPVRKDRREAAGIKVGDTVELAIELDTAPRKVRAPAELASALAKNPKAKAAWEKLSFSHQREHAEAIREAKRPETRARRVRQAVAMLVTSKR